MKALLSFLAVVFSICLYAVPFPPEMTLKNSDNGVFSLGDLKFEILFFNQKWNTLNNRSWKEVKVQPDGDGKMFTGTVLWEGGKGTVTHDIIPVDTDKFTVKTHLKMEPPIKFNALTGCITGALGKLRVAIDGKALDIPSEFGKPTLYSGKPRQVVIQGEGPYELVVTGITGLRIEDNRRFNNETCSIRFSFSPLAGMVGDADLNLDFELRRFELKPISLKAAINRTYRDDTPGKPGWTAQGPDADLGMFKPGQYVFQGIPFDLSAPGAVAVGGENRGGVPAEVTIPLSGLDKMKALNLIHTSAWTPVGDFGKLEFNYTDKPPQVITLSGKRDCGNWAGPEDRDNALVVWTGDRGVGQAGFYFSSFPLENENPVSVTFRATRPDILWFIQGMVFSEKPLVIPRKLKRESRISIGKEWVELDFDGYPAAGSALDFSGGLDAPAGKYGFAKAMPGGTMQFENAPGRRLKLFGINLCQTANFPSRETAVRMADSFARTGYNSVRFHHHDGGLVKADAADSVTLDPETLERFDFFFAELKKRGFYMTTDFYASRPLKEGDNIPETGLQPKALFPVSKAAMDNWKAFVRNWMTHRNPYTGLTYAEDPALVLVNLVNEDNLTYEWNRSVGARDFYAKLFEEYKRKNNLPNAVADNTDRHFLAFLVDLQNRSLAEMARFVKEDLKMKTAVTSLNHQQQRYLVPMRNRFDVVDDHMYHAHPIYQGKAWNSQASHSQTSTIAGMASLPRSMMASRITGKPFFVTEFNFCYPNQYRAESGPVIGGYAALQNWDGLYRFCYSHNIKRVEQKMNLFSPFETVYDPVMQLSERIIHSLFLRGDALAAPRAYSSAIPENLPETQRSLTHSSKFEVLGLTAQIGSHVEGARLPAGTVVLDDAMEFTAAPADVQEWKQGVEKKRIKSSTSEITLDAAQNTLIIHTPKTEVVTLKKGGLNTGGCLSVTNADVFQTVAAISLDNRELAGSGRILMLQLTDVLSNNIVFEDSDRKIIKASGKWPLIAHRGKAEVALKLKDKEKIKVTALSPDGVRRGEIPAVKQDGAWKFTVDTGCFPGGVMAYEIVAE